MLVEVKKLEAIGVCVEQVLRYKESNLKSDEFKNPRYILAAPSFREDAKTMAHDHSIELKQLDVGMLLSLWAEDEFLPKKDEYLKVLEFYEKRLKIYIQAYLSCCACYRKQQRMQHDENITPIQLEMMISTFQQKLIEMAMKGKVWLYGSTGGGVDIFDKSLANWTETCIKRGNIEDCDKILSFVEREIQDINDVLIHEDVQAAEMRIKKLKEEEKEEWVKSQERFVQLLKERTDISKKFRLDADTK